MTYTIHADGNDTRQSNSYELAAKKAFSLCRQFQCEVTISHKSMGIMERFKFDNGSVIPA